MDTKEVLIQARELIADPESWCKGSVSRDKDGKWTPSGGPDAVAFCAAGACSRIGHIRGVDFLTVEDARNLLDDCARSAGFTDKDKRAIANLNDDTDHPTVLKAFDCAIAKAE